MLASLGSRRPQIATKLYGAIALVMAIAYVLAAATIEFAGRTEGTLGQYLEHGHADAVAAARVEMLLAQHRRLVADTSLAASSSAPERDARAYEDYRALNNEIAAQLHRMRPGHQLSDAFTGLAIRGAAAFDFARRQQPDAAAAAAAQYAAAADELQAALAAWSKAAEDASARALNGLIASSRTLVTWVCAAAAVMGLLIGPMGLLYLGRILARMEGIGTALVRLARNDTSVDVPGLADQDEIGQMARSIAVFKAKSIELLQKKAEFERLNLQLDAAINNMPLGLSMFDAQERLLVCNRRYAEMYEVPPELTRPGTVHCALWEHRTKKGARHSQTLHGAQRRSGTMLIEFGDERVIAVSRQPIKDGGWVALHEDITERLRQEREITHLARHDALTGLANRVLFREQLAQALQRLVRGQGFAVLCLDLDHFKAVNDTLGHPIGDALLKQVAARLLSCVRHGDLVARLGGDEFAVIQANVRNPHRTEALAQRIVDAICRPFEIEGHRIEIGTSIGITLAPRDGSDAGDLIKNADLALYRTKDNGRRGYSFFEPEMTSHVQQRRALETDLRDALRNDDSFDLQYQPIVSLETSKVASCEALLQWPHPQRGTIQPDELIAIAEDTGLLPELAEWTLRHACTSAVHWPTEVRVAVNLPTLDFGNATLVDIVLQALAATGLPPHRLELEIAESVLLQASRNTHATLHQLRQLGVRIAMDDFGTGYCALSNLRGFPFDRIKIDKSFIADIERKEEARSIVSAVIGLAARLGMTTVANGIETFEQVKLLRGWGCTEAQGFLLSPTVSSGDVMRLLADGVETSLQSAA